MEKFLNVVKNPAFKAGVTIATIGLGGFLFFKDLRGWLNEKLDATDPVQFTRFLLSASILDAGVGMAWSKFVKGEPTAWNDYGTAALIQTNLILFFKQLESLNPYLPLLLLFFSWVI